MGFENHSGQTYLGPGVEPLARTIAGFGNNASAEYEGARYNNVFGSYMHGSLLPKNPHFADYLIWLALRRKYGDEAPSIPILPDQEELAGPLLHRAALWQVVMKIASQTHEQQQAQKSPWLAVNLSAVLPGAGQIYDGAIARGIVIALAHVGLIWFIVWSIFGAQGNTARGAVAAAALLCPLPIQTFWDSHHAARRVSSLANVSPLRFATSDPWYPVLLSHVLPGLGQLYLQRALVGGVLLLLGIGTAYLANFYPILLPVSPIIWAAACGLAYWASPTPRRQWGILAGLLAAIVIIHLSISSVPIVVQQIGGSNHHPQRIDAAHPGGSRPPVCTPVG